MAGVAKAAYNSRAWRTPPTRSPLAQADIGGGGEGPGGEVRHYSSDKMVRWLRIAARCSLMENRTSSSSAKMRARITPIRVPSKLVTKKTSHGKD